MRNETPTSNIEDLYSLQIEAINQQKDVARIFYEKQSKFIDETDVNKIGVRNPRHEAHILNFMSTSSFMSGYYDAKRDVKRQGQIYNGFMNYCEGFVIDIAELSRQYISMEIKFRTLIKDNDSKNKFNLKLFMNGLKFSFFQLVLIEIYIFVFLPADNRLNIPFRVGSTLAFALIITAALLYLDKKRQNKRYILKSGQTNSELNVNKSLLSLCFAYCSSYFSAAIVVSLIAWPILLFTSYIFSVDVDNLMRGQHLGGQSLLEKLSSMIQFNLPSLLAYMRVFQNSSKEISDERD